MTIDLSCQKCDASFEIDAGDLLEGTERIKCPNCSAKAPQAMVEDLSNTLGDLCKAVAALHKKFGLSLALESDDLPPPYDQDEEEKDEEEDEDLLASDEDEDLLEADEDEGEERF